MKSILPELKEYFLPLMTRHGKKNQHDADSFSSHTVVYRVAWHRRPGKKPVPATWLSHPCRRAGTLIDGWAHMDSIPRRPIGSHVAGSVVVPSDGQQPRRTHGWRVRSRVPGAGSNFMHDALNSSSPRQHPDDGGGDQTRRAVVDASPTARRDGRHQITLREALSDDQLLGQSLPGKSWKPWRTLLIAAMGEALTDDEREIFRSLTQRPHEPNRRVEELCVVAGRRGGKSRAIATIVCFVSGLMPHPSLVPGEQGICLCIAPDQKQAGIVLSYVVATFERSPILRS
jgi:hypothetical protein